MADKKYILVMIIFGYNVYQNMKQILTCQFFANYDFFRYMPFSRHVDQNLSNLIRHVKFKFKDLEPIILKQKKAVRFVSKSKYNAHCNPLFSQLNVLKLQDLFQVSVSSFISK